MKQEQLLSETIHNLRFPLIVAVVFIHFDLSEGFAVRGVTCGLDEPEWYFAVIHLLSNVLSRVAVPLFFLMSGFLFFYRTDFSAEVYRRKLTSRLRTLLVPYVLWNAAVVVYLCLTMLPSLSAYFSSSAELRFGFSADRLFNTFFNDNGHNSLVYVPTDDAAEACAWSGLPTNYPLWFVRDLMLMAVLSPVVYWVVRKCGCWAVAALGVVWYVVGCVLLPGDTTNFSNAVFFFTWGALYSIGRKDFVQSMLKFRLAPIVYILLVVVDVWSRNHAWNVFLHNAVIPIGMVAAAVVVATVSERFSGRVWRVGAGATFFVYASHILFVSNIAKSLFLMLSLTDTATVMLALYLFSPLLTVGILIAVYAVLKKYLPTVASWLTGGR